MPSVGALIWISCRPLLKMAFVTFAGFWLAKKDLFGNVATRGAGQVVLNITLPGLLFSKIVTSFRPENLRDLGPLILVDIIYQTIGFLEAWLVKQCFWVPHRFRHGILAAGIWSNVGDVPTAVIMSITASAPFDPEKDSDLAVAYIAVFILMFNITLFPLGGSRIIESDYDGPDFPDDEVREASRIRIARKLKNVRTTITNLTIRRRQPQGTVTRDAAETISPNEDKKADACEEVSPVLLKHDVRAVSPQPSTSRHVSFFAGGSDIEAAHTVFSGGTCVNPVVGQGQSQHAISEKPSAIAELRRPEKRSKSFMAGVARSLRTLVAPPTLSILIAFPIALVPSLKALFVTTPSSHLPNAPDGKPIFFFIYDTASWVGNASVPLSLICLGAALATLKVPRPFTNLPLGSITSLVILKMFITPVIGILIVQGLTYKTNLIHPDDKVLRFVCMFFSSLPTATTQVILTQVYSPDGTIGHLSSYLLPQYASMFLSMTAVAAYSLSTLF